MFSNVFKASVAFKSVVIFTHLYVMFSKEKKYNSLNAF